MAIHDVYEVVTHFWALRRFGTPHSHAYMVRHYRVDTPGLVFPDSKAELYIQWRDLVIAKWQLLYNHGAKWVEIKVRNLTNGTEQSFLNGFSAIVPPPLDSWYGVISGLQFLYDDITAVPIGRIYWPYAHTSNVPADYAFYFPKWREIQDHVTRLLFGAGGSGIGATYTPVVWRAATNTTTKIKNETNSPIPLIACQRRREYPLIPLYPSS